MKAGLKKILFIGLWVIFTGGLVALMGFAQHANRERLCGHLNIVITPEKNHPFIAENDIRNLLMNRGTLPEGKPVSTVDIPALEQLVMSNPSVESCNAFLTVGGDVNITIKQRNPVARFINYEGESYYMDDRGMLMPWSDEYTAPVVLVNGFFTDGYAEMSQRNFSQISEDSAMKTSTPLDDAWQILKRINADTFFHAQVAQVYFSTDKGFELIPRVGNHCIVLGNISDLDEKFSKLMTFYREGISKTGKWNDYTTIDLQYKNQIICTKKNTDHGI